MIWSWHILWTKGKQMIGKVWWPNMLKDGEGFMLEVFEPILRLWHHNNIESHHPRQVFPTRSHTVAAQGGHDRRAIVRSHSCGRGSQRRWCQVFFQWSFKSLQSIIEKLPATQPSKWPGGINGALANMTEASSRNLQMEVSVYCCQLCQHGCHTDISETSPKHMGTQWEHNTSNIISRYIK